MTIEGMGVDPGPSTKGRWWIAGAAVLVQLALGAVYAWSVFVNPLINQMGWSRTQTALPFIVTIGILFVLLNFRQLDLAPRGCKPPVRCPARRLSKP